MRITHLISAALAATFVACAAPSYATLVLVDFSSTNGSAPALGDTNGNYWTTIAAAGTTNNLKSSTNLDTGISLTLTLGANTGFASNTASNNDPGATAVVPFNQPFAYQDALFSGNAASAGITVALSNLQPSTLYTFQVYNRRDENRSDADVTFLTGTGATVIAAQDAVTTFSGTSTAGGLISLRYRMVSGGTGAAMLNALSLSYVPEPGTASMLLFGAVAVWLFRRNR